MSKLSTKNQVTIPVQVLRDAGLAAGDEVSVRAAGPGRIEIERSEDLLNRWAGRLSSAYPEGYLERLREEWRE